MGILVFGALFSGCYTCSMHPGSTPAVAPPGWRERLRAFGNIPPLLGMVWRTSPSLAAAGVVCRLLKSLLPLAMLWIGKLIMD